MLWFRKYPALAFLVGFVVSAAILCFFFGPIGILCAVGLEVVGRLAMGFAALMDTKTSSKAIPPPDSK
jgi:uncharacterized membrane protein